MKHMPYIIWVGLQFVDVRNPFTANHAYHDRFICCYGMFFYIKTHTKLQIFELKLYRYG